MPGREKDKSYLMKMIDNVDLYVYERLLVRGVGALIPKVGYLVVLSWLLLTAMTLTYLKINANSNSKSKLTQSFCDC